MKDAWLIGCEESGVTTAAFRALGVKAFSCDTEPTRGNPAWHIQGDLLELLRSDPIWRGGVMHPPCTFVANSSSKHLYVDGKKENGPEPQRWDDMTLGAIFIGEVIEACDQFIVGSAHENPIMLRIAQEISGWRCDQRIHPWQFGHCEMKETNLCLRRLPPLKHTLVVGPPPPANDPARREWEKCFRTSPGPNRRRDRSATLPGYAAAYAEQWGAL